MDTRKLIKQELLGFSVSEDAFSSTMEKARNLRSRRRRRFTEALGACCMVLICGALFLTFNHGESTSPRNQLRLVAGPGPFANGKQVSLAEAERSFPLPLYRPDVSAASDATIDSVWIEKVPNIGLTHVAVIYKSGVRITVEPNPFGADPAGHFQKLAAEIQTGATVQDVGGVPALVIERNTDGTGKDPGSVGLVRDGVYVVVYGDLPSSDLMTIAASLTSGAQS